MAESATEVNVNSVINLQKQTEIVRSYFKAFNECNKEGMLLLLHSDVQHEINQGKTEIGVQAFSQFLDHMNQCYSEKLKNMTIFSTENSNKVSAEYDVHGTYLKTDGGLPEANGQKYIIRAGSFFEFNGNKIWRVTTYYNLPLWIEMVKN